MDINTSTKPVDVIMRQAEKICKLESALENIFMNAWRQEPSVFRSGILGNIEMALGKEKYNHLKEIYGE